MGRLSLHKAALSGLAKLEGYLKSELNANSVTVTAAEEGWVAYSATCNFGALGKRVGKAMPQVKAAVGRLTHEQMTSFRASGAIEVAGFALGPADLTVGAPPHTHAACAHPFHSNGRPLRPFCGVFFFVRHGKPHVLEQRTKKKKVKKMKKRGGVLISQPLRRRRHR